MNTGDNRMRSSCVSQPRSTLVGESRKSSTSFVLQPTLAPSAHAVMMTAHSPIPTQGTRRTTLPNHPTPPRLRSPPASPDTARCWSASTTPRRGEKISYYSAVRLETGEVEVMELEGNNNAATSTAFLRQLRARHPEPLIVIRDNSPAHRGDAIRAYLTTPNLNLRLVHPVSSTGRLCPATVRTSTPMRPSGAGRARQQRPTSAWVLVLPCEKRWEAFSPI